MIGSTSSLTVKLAVVSSVLPQSSLTVKVTVMVLSIPLRTHGWVALLLVHVKSVSQLSVARAPPLSANQATKSVCVEGSMA